MSIVIIAIGLPGSGKTTLLRPFVEKYGLSYISRDLIYNEMFDLDSNHREVIGEVWEETNRRLRTEIQNKNHVLRDSTFADPEERRDTIRDVRAWGAHRVVGVFVDVDPEVAKDRNQKRERVVGDEVIDWRYLQLCHYPPGLEDGFDAFYTSDQVEEFERIELIPLKDLAAN
ncbi:MAG: ATP-binding protein [Candidatus Paceibacterota bacterium]